MARIRSHVASAALLTAVAVLGAPAATAAAASDAGDLVVKVVAGQVDLQDDGTVSVGLRIRCEPPLDAFEVGVTVRQGATSGSVTTIGGDFPDCSGRWERTTVSVSPDSGAFTAGAASVGAYVAAYDAEEDEDLLTDVVRTVRL